MRYTFMRFPEGKAKCVTLSYDDARKSDIRFSDLLEKYNLKCTFNINGEKFRNHVYLTNDEIKTYLIDRGHEIAVHGYDHRASGHLRAIEGIRDVLDNRIEIEQTFGMIVRGMAYPDSGINYFKNPDYSYEKVKNYLTELDVAYARNTRPDGNEFKMPTDWHDWHPTAHHDHAKIFEFIDEFLNIDVSEDVYIAARKSRLFYLWGHSFEFDSKNNWEHGEEVLKRLSGHKDVWYATNGELYDYVQAYTQLKYSVDGKIIHNPTSQDIYLCYYGKQMLIPAGDIINV